MEKKRLRVLRDSGGRTGGKCTAKGGKWRMVPFLNKPEAGVGICTLFR